MKHQPKFIKAYPILLKLSLLFPIFRFFNSTISGIFSLLILFYFLSPHIGLSNPFTPLQLLDWLISLSSDYKIAVISSLLTIIGFLVAFQAATLNWKKQLLTEAKLKAAEEIRLFYTHISSLITEADIFAKHVIKAFQLIEKKKDEKEIKFQIGYIYSKYDEFLKVQHEISELSSEMYVFREKHFLLTSGILGGQKKIDNANEELSELSKKIYAFLAPPLNDDNIDIDYFIRFTKKEEFEELHDAIKNSDLFFGINVGYVKGYLMSAIIEPNFLSILNALKDAKKHYNDIVEETSSEKSNQ